MRRNAAGTYPPRLAAWLCAFLLIAVSVPLDAHAEAKQAPHSSVELISENSVIAPGQSFTLGLLFKLDPNWHIYWVNPGDSGEPPRVKWQLPQGFSAGELQWPTPKRLPTGPLMDFGYEQEVLLPVQFQASASLPNEAPIHAAVKWLVCSQMCIPAKAELDLTLPTGVRSEPNLQTAPLFHSARTALPNAVPSNWKLSFEDAKDEIKLKINSGGKLHSAIFFPLDTDVIQDASPQRVQKTASGFNLALKKSDQINGAVTQLRGLLVDSDHHSYQFGITPAGAAAVTPVAGANSASIAGASSTNTSLPSSSTAAPASSAVTGSMFRRAGGAILFAFLGGIILNVMPCVFPVLSLKLLAFVNAGHKDRMRLRRHGLVYSAGILVSFWLLVAVLLLLREGGRHVGWGFQLQSPGFVAFLAALLLLFALNLTGLFEIGYGLMGAGSGLAGRNGVAGSFFTGVLATVVATPCTAPFMGTAVGFALAQPASVAVLVFTSLALGLAAPFLLLSIQPAWIRFLPQPGRWMETLKQLFAFPLFATVIWLVWVFGQQTSIDAMARLLALLLLVSVAAWVVGRWPRARLSLVVAIALLVAGVLWFRTTDLNPPRVMAASATGEWESFSPDRLAQYRLQGKPVFVDFTAAWCLTCQVNERVVLRTQEFRDAVREHGIVLMKADWTSYDPSITQALASLGRSAVPLYVIYGPKKDEQPIILPEGLLTSQQVVQTLDQIR